MRSINQLIRGSFGLTALLNLPRTIHHLKHPIFQGGLIGGFDHSAVGQMRRTDDPKYYFLGVDNTKLLGTTSGEGALKSWNGKNRCDQNHSIQAKRPIADPQQLK